MTLAVADVIDEARDHSALLSETNAPSKLLLRELSRGIRDLFTQIAPRVPEFVALNVSIEMADIDFSTGAAVDLATQIPDGWLDLTQIGFTAATAPVPGATIPTPATIVPWMQRNRPARFPAVTFRNDVLYIIGTAAQYGRYGTMQIQYTPNPDALTLGGDVPLPADAKDCLGIRLAAFGLGRLQGNPNFDVDKETVAEKKAEAKESRRLFLQRVFRLSQKQDHRMKDVNADPGGPWIP